MKEISLSLIFGLTLGVGMVFFGGCQKNPTPPKPVVVQDEGSAAKKPVSFPFIGDDINAASEAVVVGVRPLYGFGIGLFGFGLLVGLVTGIPAGLRVMGGGLLGIASAVLFTEFPRSVLLIPLALVGFLIFKGACWLKRFWDEHRALKVITPTIDKMDTGPRSAGRKLKEQIEKTGFAETVRKGLKYIKGLFKANG